MGKQTKVKKPENLGKGKVTPVQVAFIVDQYLVDNKFTQTSTIFRTEASTLISKTQVRQAPKSLLSLGAILDEYICLKEQKVLLDQEKCRLDQDKFRVETLLQGMNNVMNDYNSSGSISPLSISPMASPPMALIPRFDPTNNSSAVYPMNRTSTMSSPPAPLPWVSNTTPEPKNFFSTPTTANISRTKRKSSKQMPTNVPSTTKRTRKQMPTNEGKKKPYLQENPTSSTQQKVQPHFFPPPRDSSLQGSSVAKSLFKHSPPTFPNTNSPGPNTPPQVLLNNTEADLSVSPLESSLPVNSTIKTSPPQEITPTSCSLVSPDKVTVSPSKRFAYYSIERNHYISSSSSSSPIRTPSKRLVKRDHVKGRLDFDDSSVPMSLEKPMMADLSSTGPSGEADIFNMDIPNFDAFGADFSLSELLVDIDFGCEGTEPASDHSSDFASGSGHDEFEDARLEPNQTLTEELSSTVSEVLCEKNMNIEGQESLASVKSITKCIRILSPAKNRRNSPVDQEKLSSRD